MTDDTKLNRIKTIVVKLSNPRTELMAQTYRAIDGYPKHGFSSKKKYDDFIDKHGTSKYFGHFMTAAIEVNKELGIDLDTYNLYEIYRDLYLYGEVSKSTLKTTDATGCEWMVVTEGALEERKKKLEKGLYIRIGRHTDAKHLRDFVKEKGDIFRGYQHLIWSEPTHKRIRVSTKKEKHAFIYELSKKSVHELKKLGGGSGGRKDLMIVNILIKNGYGRIEDGTVRSIISDQRKKNVGFK